MWGMMFSSGFETMIYCFWPVSRFSVRKVNQPTKMKNRNLKVFYISLAFLVGIFTGHVGSEVLFSNSKYIGAKETNYLETCSNLVLTGDIKDFTDVSDLEKIPSNLNHTVNGLSLNTERKQQDDAKDLIINLLQNQLDNYKDKLLDYDKNIRGESPQILKIASTLVEYADEDRLKTFVKSYTNFTDDDIDRSDDIRKFSKRLLEIAADGMLEKTKDKTDVGDFKDKGATNTVRFYSNDSEVKNIFEEKNKHIYAEFDTDQYKQKEIFVKWYKSGSPNIYLFEKHKINPENDVNHVWLRENKGWSTGVYNVEFYAVDERMEKVAFGQYDVK